jgi:hypothetical protein
VWRKSTAFRQPLQAATIARVAQDEQAVMPHSAQRQFYNLRHAGWTSGSGALPNPFIIAQGYTRSQLAQSSDQSAT